MKKRGLLLLFACILNIALYAQQDAKNIIREVNKKFQLVQDYNANLEIKFDIPSVKLKNITGRVYFKKPNKFKIKGAGLFLLPKQNPIMTISNLLMDTSSYTAIITGTEIIDGQSCVLINIIPLKSDVDLVLGKFWVQKEKAIVLQTQITTKNNGTLQTHSYYNTQIKWGLPDRVVVQLEMKAFKVPKMIAVDIQKKSSMNKDKNTLQQGSIDINMSDYKINTKIKDEVFVE